MTKSQILIDLVSGNDNLESVLMRLKVILIDLNNDEINKWIDSEIKGYGSKEDVPPYRILKGQPIGTYILGNIDNGLKHTNAQIPLGHLLRETRDLILNVHLTDGVLGIKSLLESNGQVALPVPADVCHQMSYQGLYIVGMNINLSVNQLQGVIANIKNKLTDIVLKLEKDFGNLDSLDVFSNETDKKTLKSIEQYIINVIYDNSISVGSNNIFKKAHIGNERGGK